MDIYAGECKWSYICLQQTQIIKCCMQFYAYCPNPHIGTMLLFYFRKLAGQKTMLQSMGPINAKLHRALMVASIS